MRDERGSTSRGPECQCLSNELEIVLKDGAVARVREDTMPHPMLRSRKDG